MYSIKRFEDHVVAVTGGAKGIGGAAACALLKKAPKLPSWTW